MKHSVLKSAIALLFIFEAISASAATDYGDRSVGNLPTGSRIILKKEVLIKANEFSTSLWSDPKTGASCEMQAESSVATDRVLAPGILNLLSIGSDLRNCGSGCRSYWVYTLKLGHTDGSAYPLSITCESGEDLPLNAIVKSSAYIGSFIIPAPDRF